MVSTLPPREEQATPGVSETLPAPGILTTPPIEDDQVRRDFRGDSSPMAESGLTARRRPVRARREQLEMLPKSCP